MGGKMSFGLSISMANISIRSLRSPLTILIAVALATWSNGLNQGPGQPSYLDPTSTMLTYHGGSLLTNGRTINVYLVWYGAFSRKDRISINNFFSSISNSSTPLREPTVSAWWKTISAYKDKAGKPVPATVGLVKQLGDIYSSGKYLKRIQIAEYVKNKIASKSLPLDSNGIYLFLTAKDVSVERFCMGACGFHDSIMVPTRGRIVYAHVGDPSIQCPGLCAWPYAVSAYGPPGQALVAPNGVGADGMIINIATILAGAATNPFKTGYFQGDALAPLEAVTACPGIFGGGAYPGYPGDLKMDKTSEASFNAYGAIIGSKFLVPAIWDPLSFNCKVIA